MGEVLVQAISLVAIIALGLGVKRLGWLALPVPVEVKVVLCMVYFAPIAAMAPGYTAEVRGDVELSTFMTSVTILVGMAAMPLVLTILG